MKSKRTRTFVIVILLLSAAVVFYALVLRDPSVDTPPVVLPTAMPTGLPGGDGPSGENVLPAEVTPETVQAVIATLSRAGSYSRTITTVDYWKNGSAETVLSVWAHNGNMRIHCAGDGRNVLLLSDGNVCIWYDDGEDCYVGPGSAARDGDAWLRSTTYEDLLDMPVEDITDAGYTDFNGVNCVYAEYHTKNFGYRTVLYVDTATGLLMGAETWDEDTLIYRMSSSAPDLTTPSSSRFTPPEGAGF